MSTSASSEWHQFLEKVQNARVQLRCSASSAWFRGHSDASWLLQPTILREYVVLDSVTGGAPHLPFHVGDDEFKELFRLTEAQGILRLRMSADQAKIMRSSLAEAKSLKDNISKHSKRAGELRKLLALVPKSRQAQKVDLTMEELNVLARRYRIPLVPHEDSAQAVRDTIRALDEANLRKLVEAEGAEQKRHGARLDALRQELRAIVSVAYGERDAFAEFNFRWNGKIGNSWSILALMQHYGTSTRLLDWSESLFIALWFALKEYIAHVERARRQTPDISTADIVALTLEKMKAAPQPSVWVMNPYNLAQDATGRNRISDFTLGEGLDYYKAFFQEGWPYKIPVPIYSPWRDSDRLSSQYAMFTVHGTDLRPLNQQVGERTLCEIRLSQPAAAFGAHQLNSMFPTDRFSLFRDMDSLGKVVNDRHILRH